MSYYDLENLKAENERLRAEMPCGHPFACWVPREGTITGALEFRRDPVAHGYCRACAEVRRARAGALEEAVRIAREEHDLYLDSARRCDAAGGTHGGTLDTASALGCERVAQRLELLASGDGA